MAKFNVIETPIEGLLIVELTVFGDQRGFFLESYSKRDFQELGIDVEFVQDNHSKSSRGVLRGMHFQTEHTGKTRQSNLRCRSGCSRRPSPRKSYVRHILLCRAICR